MGFLVRLQDIDRRVLYLLLAVAVSFPFLFPAPVPDPAILPQTQSFFRTVEAVSADPVRRDKLVILSCNFSSSTSAESLTQTETVMRHLMKNKLKFAIFSFNDPQGRELGQLIANRLQDEYGYQYGRDYVNWGFRPPAAAVNTVKAMVRNIPEAIGTDANGTRLVEIPVMRNIRGANDLAAIIEITGSNSLPVWLQYLQRTGAGAEPIPTLYCPTAVMAPEAFPLLKSGQLQGMLTGLKGAIEYEALLNVRGFATRASASLSYSHFLILALIVLGNLGTFAARAQARRGGAR